MLFLLFLAVTSAVSTEQVAVSNILTYDIYATYINKNPTEKQILWISRVTIAAYCVVMGGIATAFNYIGVSMGYLYVLMVRSWSFLPFVRSLTGRGVSSGAQWYPSQCVSPGNDVMVPERSWGPSLDSVVPLPAG